MAKKRETTEIDVGSDDKFWGQPHQDNETFSVREFEQDYLAIYQGEPFLGGISIGIGKGPDPNASTAYIGFNKKSFELFIGYNPYFFRSLNSAQRQGVLIHELYHAALQHLFERNITNKKYTMAWNVATDLAINSILSRAGIKLPEFALIPGVEPKQKAPERMKRFIKNVGTMQTSEFYFEGIKQVMDEMEQHGETMGSDITLDDHQSWEQLPDGVKDQIRDKVSKLITDAVNRADSKNAWGTVPSSIQEEIRKSLKSEINWRSIMKMFFGTARSHTVVSTVKKINKKMPGILPGMKRGTTAKFVAFIDQSGSMSDEDVALAFAEVEGASKETSIEVYNFDTEVDEESRKIWQRGKKFPWVRTRSGGTDFNAVAKFVNSEKNKGKWSGVIILSDGMADVMGPVIGAKVLWVITPTGTTTAARPGDLFIQLQNEKKNQTT